ncbi:MAG: hypothetical protein WGN25_06515 [Candidatus Electrothrix sp. GW3-4]|uniref:hypothetical protein n=1 Tax=Candidatus Electrothrix sp. GW3-4 TaxID=3126740 RepID=UPI0030CB9C15
MVLSLENNSGTSGSERLPSLEDFSGQAVQKAVRSESLFHPVSLYSTSLGLLSGLGWFLFDISMLAIGMVGLLCVGAGMAGVNMFFRRDIIARQYLNRLSGRFAREREGILQTLSTDLEQCPHIKGAELYGVQAQQQYVFIKEKYDKFRTMLDQKLKHGELTYARFLGAAEQVYLGGLDTLRQVVILLQSVSTIDPEYIAGRLAELEQIKTPDSADEREYTTLKKRLALMKQQLKQVNSLLTDNEESITIMNQSIATVAQMRTGGDLASMDLETAMENLQELAKRNYHST